MTSPVSWADIVSWIPFRWQAGMRGTWKDGAGLVVDVDDAGTPRAWIRYDPEEGGCGATLVTAYGSPGWAAEVWCGAVPDIGHAPTIGGLLDVVRQVEADPAMHVAKVRPSGPRAWGVCSKRSASIVATGPTEGVALAEALRWYVARERA